MDAIYQRINDDVEILNIEKPPSEITEFYKGKTIFLTGCTGFIGKCLVEKILRTCCDIKKLYIMIRSKKNHKVDERIKSYFDDTIFDVLKEQNPNFLAKVKVVVGDLALPGINLSPEDRQLLIETVDVIIHNASLVIFTAKISTLLTVNVLGTKEMLDLASECHHLKSFMYISTAYSHCYVKDIEEKFYPQVANLKLVQDMINAELQNETGLNPDVVKTMIKPWPNVYVFSKAVAESVVQDYAKKLPFPCAVYRMSVVLSTYKEPLVSWCANLNGIVYLVTTVALGIVHTVFLKKGTVYDMVPADMVANAGLVMIWDLTENHKDSREALVYNYGTSTLNPMTMEEYARKAYEAGRDAISVKTVWMIFFIICYNYKLFMILHVLFHYIPALLADTFLSLQMKKRKFVSPLLKVDKHRESLMYFITNSWNIKMQHMIRIWDRLNSTDKELFFCDLRKLDWDEYLCSYWRGIRVYLLKDPMETIDKGAYKHNLLTFFHYSCAFVLSLLVGYVLFKTADSSLSSVMNYF